MKTYIVAIYSEHTEENNVHVVEARDEVHALVQAAWSHFKPSHYIGVNQEIDAILDNLEGIADHEIINRLEFEGLTLSDPVEYSELITPAKSPRCSGCGYDCGGDYTSKGKAICTDCLSGLLEGC